MLVASCTLHFQTPDRKSDKIYKLAIELCVPAMTTEVRYRVLFEYGRRGTELRRGEKSGAVTLETARAIYLQYFREKTAEGYEVIDEMSIPATVGRSPKAAPRPLSVAQALLYCCPRCRNIRPAAEWGEMEGMQSDGGEWKRTDDLLICERCTTRVRPATALEIQAQAARLQPAPPGPSLARQLADEARRVQAAELEAQLERDLAAASALRPRTRAPAPSFQPARRKYRE
jgi:hypothetical protein